jgi:tRNA (cytidine/uridine-2'-O-)-methyltransferase
MDYIDKVNLKLHASWKRFYEEQQANGKVRIILLTTKGSISHTNFNFNSNDVLLLGRESAGVPKAVHMAADARIIIPIAPETRSLNIASSAAIVLGEALRQTDSYPK